MNMHLKSLLVGGLMTAALSLASVGCNENDPITPTGNAPTAPTSAKAVSLSSTSVGVSWTPSTDTGTITYTVKYMSNGTVADSGSISNITGSSTTVTGLTAKAYTFEVYAVRGTDMSTAASVIWAPASRYNGSTIRMYEKLSGSGSGLTIDPALGGPQNVSVSSSVNPDLSTVQLVMFVTPTNNVLIGSAYGIDEYKNVDGFNRNVYISDSVYAVPSLDAWYENVSLDQRINTASGNLSYFTLPATVSGSNTFMFYVRTGSTASEYHYARVLVKSPGGKVLQGSGNDRYVEMEISYQNTPALPYAKVPAGAVTPRGVIGSQLAN